MNAMNSRLIGGILLIVGTSIGGGMLALPIANAPMGFIGSSVMLLVCWAIMLLGALAVLEVSLWLSPGANLVSMADATLGKIGKAITWIFYLFLLYAILSAYIAGSSDVFRALFQEIGFDIPAWLSTLLFVFCFGGIVYAGVHAVDYANRGLMFGKLGVCFLLLILIFPHVFSDNLFTLQSPQWPYLGGAIMVSVTSFGFANIIPSLRMYFKDDVAQLRKAILIGSLIPLVTYIAWSAAIMGVIALNGQHGLMDLLSSPRSTSELTQSLMIITNSSWITYFFRFFTSICMLTAFLGVSLGLFDFLADGLKIPKKGSSGWLIATLAYFPPVMIVLFYPGAFIAGLRYAGMSCVVLLLLMPALMLWCGRYTHNIAGEHPYQVPAGKGMILVLVLCSLVLMYLAIPQ